MVTSPGRFGSQVERGLGTITYDKHKLRARCARGSSCARVPNKRESFVTSDNVNCMGNLGVNNSNKKTSEFLT